MAIDYNKDVPPIEIDLDLKNKTGFPSVPLKQYDQNDSWIVVTLWDNGNEYLIPTGTIAQFATTKPSGLGILNPCIIEGNKIYYQITLQTTVEYGNFVAELRLGRSDTDAIAYSTPKFNLNIEKSALQDATILSTPEVNILSELITEANDALANIGEATAGVATAITNANTAATNADSKATLANTTNNNVTAAEGLRVTAENTRVTNETARGTAESTRVTQENTRKTNETSRVTVESARVTAESGRASTESARVASENTRVSNETTRGNNETARISAETTRGNSEATRVSNEASRVTSEGDRVSAESTRGTNETTRQNNESTRVSSESSRVTAENARVTAESTRSTNETTRNSAESGRVSAESTRGTNETTRQTFYNAYKVCVNYSATTPYKLGNHVYHLGCEYQNLVPCTGVAPIDSADSTNWKIIARRGSDGTGSGDMNKSTYDPQNKAQDIFAYVDSKSSSSNFQTAGGTGTAITLTGVTLTSGNSYSFIASANNSGSATTINTKSVYKENTILSPTFISGKSYTVWYNGTSFFVKASSEGDAVPSDVLAGKTASSDTDTGFSGTIPVHTSGNNVLADSTWYDNTGLLGFVPASGHYYNGGGVYATSAEYLPENIRANKDIFGEVGTFTADATAIASNILLSKTAGINGIMTTGTMPNNGALSNSLTINGTYTIPSGYTTGGSVTQSISTKSAVTYNPSTSIQTIVSGQYLSGDQTISAVTGTAVIGDVLASKTFSSASGILQTGGIASKTSATYSPSISTQTIASGQYLSGNQTIAATTGTALVSDVLATKTFNSASGIALTGNIASKTAQTYSPSTTAQTIASGQYLSGAQTIAPTVGTAVIADVLATKTFNSASGIAQTGGMVNNGAVVITPSAVQQAIAAGYHNGSGYVAASTGKKTAVGTGGSAYWNGTQRLFTITGLSFTPSYIHIYYSSEYVITIYDVRNNALLCLKQNTSAYNGTVGSTTSDTFYVVYGAFRLPLLDSSGGSSYWFASE